MSKRKLKNYIKGVIIFFVIVTIIAGCRNKLATEILEDITYLPYMDMEINEDSIFRPTSAVKYMDKLILIDDLGRNLLKVIDLSQGEVICQTFFKGRGPEEVGYITHIDNVFGNENEFYIVDPNNRRLTFFNIDSLIEKHNHFLKKEIINSIDLRPWYLLQYSDSMYVAIGINTLNDKRLTIYNKNLEPVGFYLDYPISKKEDPLLNNFLLSTIFQYDKDLRSDGKRMVNVLRWSDYFEIIDLTKEEPEIIYSEYSYLPEYRITGERSHHKFRDAKKGYQGVKATDKYIFLFYSENPTDPFIDMILVTDWDGRPVMKFGLELPIRKFVRDNDHSFLYGFTAAEMDDGRNRLVKYELIGLE